jgi:hypothetical protein
MTFRALANQGGIESAHIVKKDPFVETGHIGCGPRRRGTAAERRSVAEIAV